MTVELAEIRAVRKPWGRTHLAPWSGIEDAGFTIGELWFQRADTNARAASLLLKLLFTDAPLSIQVHPNDAFARSVGLANGKTEAWYILSAAPDAQVAVGLKRCLTAAQLRSSIEDGSISQLIQWQPVSRDDVIFVPAGTIHAIGAGLILAEIQQRSDATFRLFDYGRQRELHIDNAVAAANVGLSEPRVAPERLTDARTLLVANPHFILERIDLLPNSNWKLLAEQEAWLLILDGDARVGLINASVGEAIFAESDHAVIEAGSSGMKGLLAYLGPSPCPGLLQNIDEYHADFPIGIFLSSALHQNANASAPACATEAGS